MRRAADYDADMSVLASSSLPADSVTFSKAADALSALSTGRRLGILSAVAELNAAAGPARLADVAQKVGLDLKTLSKEVVRLTEAGLVTREGASLTARPEALGDLAASLAEHTALNRIVPPDSPLRRYLSHGRITGLPKRPEDLEALALALAALLPEDRSLTENEVNTLLAQAGDDVARLRRLLADFALVDRAGSAEYRRRPLPGPTAAP